MDKAIKMTAALSIVLSMALFPLQAQCKESSAESVSRLMKTKAVKKRIQACVDAGPHPDFVNMVIVVKPKGRAVLSSTIPPVEGPLLKCFRSAVHKHVKVKGTGAKSMVFYPMALDAPEKETAAKPAGKVKIKLVSTGAKAKPKKPLPAPVKAVERRTGSKMNYLNYTPILGVGLLVMVKGALAIAGGGVIYGLMPENTAAWATVFAIGGTFYLVGLVLCGVSARLRRKAEESLHASAIPGLSVAPIASGKSRGMMTTLTWTY